VPDIEMLEENNTREGFFEHAEYLAMRALLPDHERTILVIAYHLGMWAGEIINLRWDQVDWKHNLIRLEKKQTKGKQARVAPLHGELRAWLEMAYAARGDCQFLVNYEGEGIHRVQARVEHGAPSSQAPASVGARSATHGREEHGAPAFLRKKRCESVATRREACSPVTLSPMSGTSRSRVTRLERYLGEVAAHVGFDPHREQVQKAQ
jgi:integrase-like protein